MNTEIQCELHRAVTLCGIETIKSLINDGADIHFEYETPLKLAAEAGRLDVVKFILNNYNINIDIINNMIDIILMRKHYRIIEYLLEYGATLNMDYADKTTMKRVIDYLLWRSINRK